MCLKPLTRPRPPYQVIGNPEGNQRGAYVVDLSHAIGEMSTCLEEHDRSTEIQHHRLQPFPNHSILPVRGVCNPCLIVIEDRRNVTRAMVLIRFDGAA